MRVLGLGFNYGDARKRGLTYLCHSSPESRHQLASTVEYVRVVGRVDCPAGTIGNGTCEKHGEDAVVEGARLGPVEGEEDQSTAVIEVGIVEQGEEPEIDPAGGKVDCDIVTMLGVTSIPGAGPKPPGRTHRRLGRHSSHTQAHGKAI